MKTKLVKHHKAKIKVKHQRYEVKQSLKYSLKHKYGMTLSGYEHLLASQHYRCAICRGRNKSGRLLSVDHDHDSKKVRGLLCYKCNSALGFLGENTTVLARAITYLEENKWLIPITMRQETVSIVACTTALVVTRSIVASAGKSGLNINGLIAILGILRPTLILILMAQVEPL